MRADDDDAVEEVEGEAVRGAVGCAADPGVAAVAGHDDDGGQDVFEGAVDVGEAFDVQHVDFVDEKDPGDYLGLAFLFPLSHLRVDLIPDFAADFSCVTGEKRQEALGSRVDDVYFVQADGVYDFFPLLEFSVWALNEFGVCAHCIVVA